MAIRSYNPDTKKFCIIPPWQVADIGRSKDRCILQSDNIEEALSLIAKKNPAYECIQDVDEDSVETLKSILEDEKTDDGWYPFEYN